MTVSDLQLRRGVVALVAQLVGVRDFRPDELEDALANVGNPGYAPSSSVSVAVRGLFVSQGSLSVAATLDRVAGTATSEYALAKTVNGFAITAV